jgi:plastocyanin
MKYFQRYIKFLSFSLLVAVIIVGCGDSITDRENVVKESFRGKQTIHTVEIKQMMFSPSEIIVNKGDSIIFINKDLVAHDVTELANKKWSSGPLQSGQSWMIEVLGEATYYCSLHEVMRGKILVK